MSLPFDLRMLAFVAILALPSASGCSSRSQPEATEVDPDEAYELLVNTPWIDHMPADERDELHILLFDREGFGGYVNGTPFRGSYDIFEFDEDRGLIELTFLQDDATAKTKYRVERMSRKGFDLRVTFSSSPRGPKSYYGFDEAHAVPEAVRAQVTAARRTFTALRESKGVTP